MKRTGFNRGRKPEQSAPSKILKRPTPGRSVLDRERAKPGEERCPHFFEQHGTHIRQQCTRGAGHYGHHYCAGIKCDV